jgi:hypothetical protein
MRVKTPRNGYVRCDTLLPVLSCEIAPIPGMPTQRVLWLLTEDGAVALRVTAKIAQQIAGFLARAATAMRKAS